MKICNLAALDPDFLATGRVGLWGGISKLDREIYEEFSKDWEGLSTKAESIVKTAKIITEQYGGKVPDSLEKLLELPGVGRKIANLVLGDIYNIPGIVADTHCIRINGRLGYYPEALKDPARVEKILSGIIPPEEQTAYCHRMVLSIIIKREMNVSRTEEYIEDIICAKSRLAERESKPKGSEQKRKLVIRDIRLFYNSIDHAVDVIKKSGIPVESTRKEVEEGVLISILLPKKAS